MIIGFSKGPLFNSVFNSDNSVVKKFSLSGWPDGGVGFGGAGPFIPHPSPLIPHPSSLDYGDYRGLSGLLGLLGLLGL